MRVGGCWWALVGVGGCWRGVGCWWVLVGVGGCRMGVGGVLQGARPEMQSGNRRCGSATANALRSPKMHLRGWGSSSGEKYTFHEILPEMHFGGSPNHAKSTKMQKIYKM